MNFKDIRGYKLDLTARVITINYKFAKEYRKFGTPEYNLVKTIMQDFPDLKVVEMAGRQSKTCHHDKNLTYLNMETYISTRENADELMAAYWIARTEAIAQTSRYAHVRKWFIKQFPHYREVQMVVEQTTVVKFASKEKEAS